jgi:hypothetical protein
MAYRLRLALALLLICSAAIAGETTSTKAPASEVVQLLQAPNEQERREALRLLTEEREAVVQRMIALLQSHKNETSGQEDGVVHVTVEALAKWKATEATGILIDMISFKVTFRAGAKRPLGAEYACAFALADMGGRSVLDAVGNALAQEGPQTRTRLLAWVVFRVGGAQGGRAFLLGLAEKASVEKAGRLRTAAESVGLGDQLIAQVTTAGEP